MLFYCWVRLSTPVWHSLGVLYELEIENVQDEDPFLGLDEGSRLMLILASFLVSRYASEAEPHGR